MARSKVQTAVGVGLVAVLVLAGCAGAPIRVLPGPGSAAAPTALPPGGDMIPSGTPDGAADFSVSGAEQACIAAGRERGLDVAGIVGSTAVTDSNGETSRDVMLRVRRNGAEIEVRCNYVASTRMARIMLI